MATSPLASLRTRLIGAFLLMAALAAGGSVLASTLASRDRLTGDSIESLQQQADDHARLIGTQLDAQLIALESFSLSAVVQDRVALVDSTLRSDEGRARAEALAAEPRWAALPDTAPEVRATLQDAASSELVEYQLLHPEAVVVIATDRAGGLVASSERVPRFFYGDEPWWRAIHEASERTYFVGQPDRDGKSGVPVLWMSVPLYRHSTQIPIGVLAAAIRLDQLAGEVARTKVGDTGALRVLLPDGRTLAKDGQPAALDEGQRAAVAAFEADPRSPHDLEGDSSFGALADIATSPAVRRLGWRVLVDQHAAELLAPVTASTHAGALIAVVTLLLGLIPAAAIAQVVSAPVREAAAAAARLAAGELGQRVAERGHGEIGQLARSFNTMAGALQQRIEAEEAASAERARLQEQVIAAQEATLRELSTPLIPLSRSVLLLPLIGSVDSRRAEEVLRALMDGVAASRASTVILDLTGVAVVDTHVGRVLLRAAQGVRLLGARVVLVGIRAEVAQTIVGLGIDVESIAIYRNLESAIDALMLAPEPAAR